MTFSETPTHLPQITIQELGFHVLNLTQTAIWFLKNSSSSGPKFIWRSKIRGVHLQSMSVVFIYRWGRKLHMGSSSTDNWNEIYVFIMFQVQRGFHGQGKIQKEDSLHVKIMTQIVNGGDAKNLNGLMKMWLIGKRRMRWSLLMNKINLLWKQRLWVLRYLF